MASARTLLLLSLFVLGCLAAFELDGDVVVLKTSDFYEFVDNEDVSLVEFYAPWCGHCKNLAPEYAKAATTLRYNQPSVRIAKVDATVESSLAQKYGVSSYPTLKVFRKGQASDYKGPREANGIITYMQKQALPSISLFRTLAEFEKFVQNDPATIWFGEPKGLAYREFESTANKHREVFRFGQTNEKEILDAVGYNNEVVFYQAKKYSQSPLEVAKVVYKDGELVDFISKNYLPLVGDIHPDNLGFYVNKELPLVKIYADIDWQLNPKGANYLLNKIRKVAKDYADKFAFSITSKSKNQKEVDDFGLPKGENPVAIVDLKKGYKYPSKDLFAAETLKAHLEAYIAGQLENYIKSEPVPEKQAEDGPVVVVGKTFEQIVLDPSKDVLLEAYAPWCGHCKSLEPKYKELAQEMAKYSDSLTIAKIDATANDMPPNFPVNGFPTILFAPAGKKDAPLRYEGQREVADFVKYIKEHVSKPLKANKTTNKEDL